MKDMLADALSAALNSSVNDLRVDLLRAIEGVPSRMFPSDVNSVAVQAQSLANEKLEVSERIKEAVTTAIVEWRPAHSHLVLKELALTAAYVRASAAITPLAAVILERRLRNWEGDSERRQTAATLVGVVAGFSPAPAAIRAIRTLLGDMQIASWHAAQLVVALAKGAPEVYAYYIDGLFTVADTHPDRFDMLSFARELVRVALPVMVIDGLEVLNDETHYKMCKLLGGHTGSPGFWATRGTRESTLVYQATPDDKYQAVRYQPSLRHLQNVMCVIADRAGESWPTTLQEAV